MFKLRFSIPVLVAVVALAFSACKKEDKDPDPLPAQTASILASANPAPVGPFAYFSLEQGATLPPTSANTDDWDFGMRFTTMIVNSGVSGPGMAGVQIVQGVFDEITEAPEDGYLIDAEGDLAVKDADWYVYQNFQFSPIAGRVFLFRTAKGKYAKMEVLGADPVDDNGQIVTPPTFPTQFRYNIRYVVQPDGSRRF
jgi:hypothetical protein